MCAYKKEGKCMASPKSETASDVILTPEEALRIYADAYSVECDSFREKISRLRKNPPQLLHIEGGSAEQRISFAHYWAALHICQSLKSFSESIGLVDNESDSILVPCLECDQCYKVAAHMHADALFYDGQGESIKVKDMRELKTLVGEGPRFAPKRVVALLEAQSLTLESANTLLKVLEEPSVHTLFIFTTAQRERLLPTLVSRGFVLTLPWLDPARDLNDFEKEWEENLTVFFRTGTGIFAKTAQKGFMDGQLAQCIMLVIQKSLSHALAGRDSGTLATIWQKLPSQGFSQADEILTKAQEALQFQTNPSYVVEVMLVELFNLLPRK